MRVAFFISAGILGYCYIVYPFVLAVLPAKRSRATEATVRRAARPQWPSMSLIVAAYNEERAIRARVRNFLEGRYPGWSELLIVSDGSTDATVAEATAIASDRVRMIDQKRRRGKAAALETAVPYARGDVLVFTDATSIFHPDALTHLAEKFADPDIGLVTGKVKAYGPGLVGMYHRFERFLESRESARGVLATAHGCIYAMRKSLWRSHDPALVDDFLDPIIVSLSDKRSVVAPDAICVEEFPARAQFARQIRMVALAAFTLRRLLPEMIRARRWRSIFVVISHKALRWLTVVWLWILAFATLHLADQGGIYRIALAAQAAFWMVTLAGAVRSRMGRRGPSTIFYDFVSLNVAGFLGVYRCLAGRAPVVWETNTEGAGAA